MLLVKVLLHPNTVKRKFCYVYTLPGDTRNRVWEYVAERQDFVWTEHRKACYTHTPVQPVESNKRKTSGEYSSVHCASSGHTSHYFMSDYIQRPLWHCKLGLSWNQSDNFKQMGTQWGYLTCFCCEACDCVAALQMPEVIRYTYNRLS